MASTVKLRPNHYELLGLTPAASSDEIAQAFARELGLLRPRAFGSLAEVTIAYETLRDPVRRRAYDASLRPEPAPESAHPLAARLEGAPFLGAPSTDPVEDPTLDRAWPPEPRVNPLSRPAPRAEPRMAPSATALLRQPIRQTALKADPVPRMKEEDLRRPEVEQPKREEAELEPQASGDRVPHLGEANASYDARDTPINWKLPALAAGALVLAVGGGAWTGWEAGNDNESVQSKPVAALKVPPPKTAPAMTSSPPASPPSSAEEPPQQAAPAAPAAVRTARIPPEPKPVARQEAPTETALIEQVPPEELMTEQVVAESASAEAATAKLPLPDAVVARTIRRIGYACGEVASTTPIEGAAPGVFKVTCSSGHTYRAAPVRGRYHFRKY